MALLKFHTQFWTHALQNMYFTVFYLCVWVTVSLNCDIISLSETGPWSPYCANLMAGTVLTKLEIFSQKYQWPSTALNSNMLTGFERLKNTLMRSSTSTHFNMINSFSDLCWQRYGNPISWYNVWITCREGCMTAEGTGLRFTNRYDICLLSHPSILGVTLCFCTGLYGAPRACAAGRRFFFTRSLLNNFLDFFHFWHNCCPWPVDYLIRFWSIFVVTLTLNFQGQI